MTDQEQQTAQQQEYAIKSHLLTELIRNYKEFILKVVNIPIQDRLKVEALRGFDIGFLWAKEGIQTMIISPPPVPSDAPSVSDAATAQAEPQPVTDPIPASEPVDETDAA